jgi:transmembrane sensor
MKKPLPVELLEKYLNGECTEIEVALVKRWYQSFEHDEDHVSDMGFIEEKELEERIYNHILNSVGAEVQTVVIPVRHISYKWYAIAGAAAAIIIVFALSLYNSQKIKAMLNTGPGTQQMVAITNNSGKIYKAILPDNSCVWLSPNAKLTFPKIFNTASRMVSISGQCFFEVTKNPDRPFIINSRSIITKVWGTSFLVKDNVQSKSAEVSVLTGKVSVSIKTTDNVSLRLEKNEVMIYPHQKVVYLIDQHVLKPENVDNEPALQIWKRVNLSFDNKPLGEIIPELNARYHVHIIATSAKLNHYILNADLAGFNLPDVLEALKKSLNVNYEIKDNSINLE